LCHTACGLINFNSWQNDTPPLPPHLLQLKTPDHHLSCKQINVSLQVSKAWLAAVDQRVSRVGRMVHEERWPDRLTARFAHCWLVHLFGMKQSAERGVTCLNATFFTFQTTRQCAFLLGHYAEGAALFEVLKDGRSSGSQWCLSIPEQT